MKTILPTNILYLNDQSVFMDSDLELQDIPDILSLYSKYGCLLFRNFSETGLKPRDITDVFTEKYARDAQRRSNASKSVAGHHFSVDSEYTGLQFANDSNSIEWHSEAHFSPSYPEAIFLYCHENDGLVSEGRTLLVDGVKIWNSLNLSQKNFFLKHQVIYKVRVDLGVSNTRKISPWYIPEPGCFDVTFNGVDSTLEFSMVRSLVNKCSKNKLAFCNYLLHNPWEPQLVSMDLFPHASYFEVISKAELESILVENQVAYSWNKGDLLMIDNRRFMHARESYNKSTSRVLELIQALELRN